MLKQVLAIAVVGVLGTGCASAHDSNWGYRDAPQVYDSSSYYTYPRYAPRWSGPRYFPPQRWGWHGGHYSRYPRGHQNSWQGHNDHHWQGHNDHNWRGNDRHWQGRKHHNGHDRKDHDDHDRNDHDRNDWNRHH